jgi:hypothetical protein
MWRQADNCCVLLICPIDIRWVHEIHRVEQVNLYTSLQESTDVPMAAVCTDGQMLGPLAQEPPESGGKDIRRR